jgi:nitrate/TMAO reductase-like tetraheme cytochrome c subunit
MEVLIFWRKNDVQQAGQIAKRSLFMTKTSLFTPILILVGATASADLQAASELSYEQARWHPLHFKPAIDEATNEQCLECHQEVLDRRVAEESPAGVTARDALAWYQTLGTYQGAQETMHRRHLVTDYASKVMDMKCNTCHQGNDPREETAMSHAGGDASLTQRKHVNPNICLMCHGQFSYQNMGVPGPWPEFGVAFQNNCLLCHATFRTNRHQVNYLKPGAIEELAKKDNDVCYGCHGGRAWYRIGFPYPRHAWPGMPEAVPDWAKDRPTKSEARFLVGVSKPKAERQPVEKDGHR